MAVLNYVIALGDPFSGLELCGPYETHDHALREAEEIKDREWHIVAMYPPELKMRAAKVTDET